jgi:hypothetical protein
VTKPKGKAKPPPKKIVSESEDDSSDVDAMDQEVSKQQLFGDRSGSQEDMDNSDVSDDDDEFIDDEFDDDNTIKQKKQKLKYVHNSVRDLAEHSRNSPAASLIFNRSINHIVHLHRILSTMFAS